MKDSSEDVSRTVIGGATVVTMDDDREILQPGYIGIAGTRIGFVAHSVPEDPKWNRVARIDGAGCIAIPGLINCHTHAGMTTMRGVADDMPLMKWLETRIWPMEARMTSEDVYWGTKLAVLEMIRGGVTCFNDMYWHSDQAAQACHEVGIRAVLSGVLIATQKDPEGQLKQAVDVVNKWKERDHSRIKFYFGPHALYTCPPAYLEAVVSHARQLATGIHIHLSETASEVEGCEREYGKSPVEVLEEVGLFSRPTIAAHCIHLSPRDTDILASHRVSAIHNPSSNMKLASGVMKVEHLLDRGVNVALGTDSAASNNNLSILSEIRMASLLQKIDTGDPSALPAATVLDLATRNGAKAIQMEGRLGQLKPGFDADIVLIRNNRIHSSPPTDPVSHLVYSLRPDDVDTVFVEGEMMLTNGEFIDIDVEEVIARSTEIVQRIRV
ncbi:MAG: amidohydrolase family protein [Fidelibacterota bacterium]